MAKLTFNAKGRPLGRLSDTSKNIELHVSSEGLDQPDGGGALSFAQRGGRDAVKQRIVTGLQHHIQSAERRDSAGGSPSHHNIFAIWLGLQTLHDAQLDFGLGLSVELHFIREQADLSGQKVNGLGNAGAGDHNVTVGSDAHNTCIISCLSVERHKAVYETSVKFPRPPNPVAFSATLARCLEAAPER